MIDFQTLPDTGTRDGGFSLPIPPPKPKPPSK